MIPAHVGNLALHVELWGGGVLQAVNGKLFVVELDGPLSPVLRDSVVRHAAELLRLVEDSTAAAEEVIRRVSRPQERRFQGG